MKFWKKSMSNTGAMISTKAAGGGKEQQGQRSAASQRSRVLIDATVRQELA